MYFLLSPWVLMYFIAYNKKRIKNVGNSYLKNGKGVVFIKSFRSFSLLFLWNNRDCSRFFKGFFSLILNILFLFISFLHTNPTSPSPSNSWKEQKQPQLRRVFYCCWTNSLFLLFSLWIAPSQPIIKHITLKKRPHVTWDPKFPDNEHANRKSSKSILFSPISYPRMLYIPQNTRFWRVLHREWLEWLYW